MATAPTNKVSTDKLDLERLSAFPNQSIWISSIAFNSHLWLAHPFNTQLIHSCAWLKLLIRIKASAPLVIRIIWLFSKQNPHKA